MHNAQLVSHVDTDIVTRADLRSLTTPEATETFKPIPHIDLVDMLGLVLEQNQIYIVEEHLKAATLPDIEAKALIHDAFASGLMPLRFLPNVSRAYFEPEMTEFAARNAWSLHNAFTGVAKAMPITTRLSAIQSLGKFFG